MSATVYVLNGPNLNLLGVREPHLYGSTTLAQVEQMCRRVAGELGLASEFRQTNHEGVMVDWVQEAREKAAGVVINPAGLSFRSIPLLDALKLTRLQVYTRHDQPLHPDELTAVRARVQRRGRREPVAYITGTRGFWSLELAVDARVLVPRPETELLVELALARLKGLEAPRVVDVGTGSGCIALSLARERPDAVITAVDASQGALAVAQKNAQTHDLKVEFRQSNLLSAVPGPLEMVVSNPPYIASAEVDQLMPDVARYEPRLALDGGPDGLALIRPLIDQAATRLVSEGWLAFEFGHDQGPAVRDLLLADGRFGDVIIHRDLAGKDRVATARRLP